jgi:hypothetical protein
MTLTDTKVMHIAQMWPPVPTMYDVSWTDRLGLQCWQSGTADQARSVVRWIMASGREVATEFRVTERTFGFPVVMQGAVA